MWMRVTCLAVVVTAYAVADSTHLSTPGYRDRPLPVTCKARPLPARTVDGRRCLDEREVMVGIASVEPMRVLCAPLEVGCLSEGKVVPSVEMLGENQIRKE
jgi:hypothetical protein